MKYRIKIDAIYEDEETAHELFEFAQQRLPQMITIREGEEVEERSRVVLERCFHDEEPTKPCEIIEEAES